MNRQYSSNTSLNLINWDEPVEEHTVHKSNSLVEMFDPIFINSSLNEQEKDKKLELSISTSSDDIFDLKSNSKQNQSYSKNNDNYEDLFDENLPRNSLYPNLNHFKDYFQDDRHSIFAFNKSSNETSEIDEFLRPSIFNEVRIEGLNHSLFTDGYTNKDIEMYMKRVDHLYNHAKELSTDIRTHLIFDRILPFNYGISDFNDTGQCRKIKNRSFDETNVSIIIRIDESCGGYGNEKFSGTFNVYSLNERELILEVIEQFKISVDFSQLYLRISGRSEYLMQSEFPIKRNSYIFQCLRTNTPVKLVLEYVDIEMSKFSQAHIIEEPFKFIYNSLEKDFITISRANLSNCYAALTNYRNMIVEDLREYRTRDMDIVCITDSVGVFKNKLRAICIECNNVFTASIAETFVSLDCIVNNLMVLYNTETVENISKIVKQLIEQLNTCTNVMIETIHKLCDYCHSNFSIQPDLLTNTGLYSSISGAQSTTKYRTAFSVKLLSICNFPQSMNQYSSFIVTLTLKVGSVPLSQYISSNNTNQWDILNDEKTSIPASIKQIHSDFNSAISFNQKLLFNKILISQLPFDTSLSISVKGRKYLEGDVNCMLTEEVCWAEISLFDNYSCLKQGNHLIGLFPGTRSTTNQWGTGMCHHKSAVILEIELPSFHVPIKYTFQSLKDDTPTSLESLEPNCREEIDKIITQVWLDGLIKSAPTNLPMNSPEIVSSYLWNNRYYLMDQSRDFIGLALSLVNSQPTNQNASTNDYRELLIDFLELCCPRVSLISELMHLLGPKMPLRRVRKWCVEKIQEQGPDNSLHLIPIFIDILKYDVTLGASGVEKMLMEFSVKNINFATSLFWNLSSIDPKEPHGYQAVLLLSSLQVLINNAVKQMWSFQLTIVEYLEKTASIVKSFKGSVADRKIAMCTNLEELYDKIFEQNPDLDPNNPINCCHILANYRLPYHPGMQLIKLEVKDCSYFNSFTMPLRIVFRGLDNENIDVMFKNGDDLRQDILILQLFNLMDEIWAGEGNLDLRPVHYRVMSTGTRSGFIELVPDCVTLRKIQESQGGIAAPLTNDTVITDWLQSQNVTKISYNRSVLNFLLTCVSSCVSTYLLGIGDRHNDNIMVQTSGRLFHIDFAKIFGDAQTFAGIKRDRVPFVLTQDMVNVLEDLQLPEGDIRTGMQLFIDLCCEAYNIIRQQWASLAAVLTIAAKSDIVGVNQNTIQIVMKRLHLEMTDTKASEYFTELIRKCVSSISTPMNFVIHNLAQMKYGANNEGSLFSFTTKVYNNDPAISDISISSVKKMRHPAKHYLYQIIVTRDPYRLSRISSLKQLPAGLNTSFKKNTLELPRSSFNNDKHEIKNDKRNNSIVKSPSFPNRNHIDNNLQHVSMTTVYRRYEHFEELAQNLAQQFPLSQLPKLANQIVAQGNPTSLAGAEQRRALLQQFIATILSQEVEISQCSTVHTFFHSILSDEQTFEAEEQVFTHNIEKTSIRKKKNPEIQLKITLKDRLEIFVKHARNLCYHRMAEQPNSYVKTYLHPNPGFSTKRKTTIVPKSASPSFNDVLSYTRNEIINIRHLEISVWHHETFGENICLGSQFIDLDQIRNKTLTDPNFTLDQWFKLNISDEYNDYIDNRRSRSSSNGGEYV